MAHIKFFVCFTWNNKNEEWRNSTLTVKIAKLGHILAVLSSKGKKNSVKKQNDLFNSFLPFAIVWTCCNVFHNLLAC